MWGQMPGRAAQCAARVVQRIARQACAHIQCHLPFPHPPQVEMTLSATKLDNKDMFGKSDPFVRISKARETGAWVPVLKTEVRAGEKGGDAACCYTLAVLIQAVLLALTTLQQQNATGAQPEQASTYAMWAAFRADDGVASLRPACVLRPPCQPSSDDPSPPPPPPPHPQPPTPNPHTQPPHHQVINNNLNPTWRPFKASMAQLCNCDPQRPLLLEVRRCSCSAQASQLVAGWTCQRLLYAQKRKRTSPVEPPCLAQQTGWQAALQDWVAHLRRTSSVLLCTRCSTTTIPALTT